MSNSRLEKFIYAICSMDVSDLPVPLSRIEKLWNCLITGETPDFEPLSRNEKYLMAMLDRYDISNLPAPMSRGEKLLYKIAVGETDLSDVPGYLSRYEELLKYLIENGGIGFEYVLYTLNQSLSTLYSTEEKPVKSAILKGQTFVNLSKTSMVNLENGRMQDIELNMNLEVGKSYTLMTNISNNDETGVTLYGTTSSGQLSLLVIKGNGLSKLLIEASKIKKNVSKLRMQISATDYANGKRGLFENIMIIEGDYTNVDIPYFEGMQSVKMPVLTTTGKNLLNKNEVITGAWFDKTNGQIIIRGQDNAIWEKIKVEPNTNYISSNGVSTFWVEFDSNFNLIKITNEKSSIQTTSDTKYITVAISIRKDRITDEFLNTCQLECGTQATSYEPYKTNILTVNEEVELHGIGNVKDTLDCLTSEVTQYFDEVTFDGSDDENFVYLQGYSNNDIALFEYQYYFDFDLNTLKRNGNMMCDKFSVNPGYLNPTKEGVYCQFKHINVMIEKSKLSELTTLGIQTYLKQNPIKMILPKQKSIKTVDLTTVDQDGQPTKIKTFNDVTYVEINADNLIPSVDVEVATKISETLSTLGLEHHDISNTQNQLGQTIDEQTENTDATMLATTEIYEQTL